MQLPKHCYLQGFGHLQGQTTLHVDCTTNVHLGGAVHVIFLSRPYHLS